MCIIIDANMASDFVTKKDYLSPVIDYVLRGGVLTICQSLFLEYPHGFRNVVAELKRGGKVKQFDDEELPGDVAQKLASDDPHVVSLVRRSGTRVVCTKDTDLIDDLKNASIVNTPRCKVYRHTGASGVLKRCCP